MLPPDTTAAPAGRWRSDLPVGLGVVIAIVLGLLGLWTGTLRAGVGLDKGLFGEALNLAADPSQVRQLRLDISPHDSVARFTSPG